MNLLNLFDLVDAVAAQKSAEKSASIPPAVQASQTDGQPATIVVPVAASDEVEVLEDDHEDSLELGDEVIITGNVQYKGKTGRITDFGRNKHFVIVDLYNFGKHSFHSSNVKHNDYADSDEEESDWQEREVNEDNSGYYYEQLAQKVFDERPNFSTKGRADELVDYAYRFAVQDLGKDRARYEFNYDEDFLSDFVSAYAELRRGEQGVAEDSVKDVTHGDHPRATDVPVDRLVNLAQAKGPLKGREAYVRFSGPVTHSPNAEDSFVRGVIFDREQESGGKRLVYWLKDDAGRNMTATARDIFVVEQGVAEEYDPSYDPEYRSYQKPERNVDWDIEADRNAPDEPESKKTVVIKDSQTGKEVARFPSTGGYYGDLRKSDELGFNFEQGDYDVKWVDAVAEGNNWLDAPVSEDKDVGPALAAWKEQIKKEYPQLADWIKFFGKKGGQVSAEIPGRDRCYGVFDMNTGKGEVLGG